MDAAAVLRAARRRSGLTLRELAERAGTSDATLSAYEHGRVTPRVDTMSRIVAAAGFRLSTDIEAVPTRDPRRAPAGEELFEVLLLAEQLPSRPRRDQPLAPHAVFPRA